MKNSNNISKSTFLVFRAIFFFLALFFFLMGLVLILFPQQMLTEIAGKQDPHVLGMLRGAGGATIPYTIMYILVALKPLEFRWIANIIAIANILAIILDFASVIIEEYTLIQAMYDVPFEFLSLVTIIVFYSKARFKKKPE